MAIGFQEIDKPQSDLPMVGKESLKLVIALAADKDLNLASMNIKAEFLQGNILNRGVFMKPQEDQRIYGWLWKLKEPLFGMENGGRKFWLKLKDTL